MRTIQIILVLVLMVSCGDTKKVTTDKTINTKEASLVMSYKQTPCSQKSTPMYEIKLFSNKQMYLEASKNMDLEGKHMRTLSDKEYNELVNTFLKANFFKLKDSYTSDTINKPTSCVFFSHNGENKKIKNCGDSSPEELKELELTIQSFLDRVGWIKMTW